jgi:type III secretory pathway component EscT
VEKSNNAKSEHSKIINKIYFAFIAPVAIFISMAAILLGLLEHNSNIDKIEKILTSIANFLGILY